MVFTKRLRDGVRRGTITCSVRVWTHPHVKVGEFSREAVERDYVESNSGCSWRTLATRVALRRSTVVGALELQVHMVPTSSAQVEREGDLLVLVATAGHPDDNGPRFLYRRIDRP